MAVLPNVETKVKAGTAVGGATGVVVWALVAFVPAFHTGVPEPVVAVLPFVLGWIGHAVAAYRAPHTHRPDLFTTSGPGEGVTLTGIATAGVYPTVMTGGALSPPLSPVPATGTAGGTPSAAG